MRRMQRFVGVKELLKFAEHPHRSGRRLIQVSEYPFRLVFLSKIDNVGSGGLFDLCSLRRRGEDTNDVRYGWR